MSMQQPRVERADFDRVMVPNYAPAGFILCAEKVREYGIRAVAS